MRLAKERRLRKNLTQKELADSIMISRATIERLENGAGKTSTLIAVMRELGQLENLELLLPDPPISPLLLAARRGKRRIRAGKNRPEKNCPSCEESGSPKRL